MQLTPEELDRIGMIVMAATSRDQPDVVTRSLTAEDIREVGKESSIATSDQIADFAVKSINMTLREAFNHGVFVMGEAIAERFAKATQPGE